ncbi:NAD(P)H-hydrate dehydratase [Haloactinopolyspora sp.]|uniref:NAD(P)H-hydrate dehydratase n=1 Tax=Haloactinopolyspora sp. TaxID=1966353 RepID=UPI002605EA5E|nr:NAD(P)H-hydrate dehydratase [Haloactinopolyspora sp.]
MIGVHSVADIRTAENDLMARLPDGALMQRAVAGLTTTVARLLDGPYGARVTVLAGGGNNGGDALWAGARLARRGARVDAVLLRPEHAHAEGLAALRAAGGRVVAGAASTAAESAVRRADVVLDGILGIGGRGGLDDEAADLAAVAHDHAGLVVAVDLPSGVVPDTGETPGRHVVADVTVTFGTGKVALVLDPAAAAAGSVHAVDIGLGPYLPDPDVEVLEPADVAALLPRPGRESDKYARGVVGVLAGSQQYTGAAMLAVGGAVHGGAGMVRYCGPDAVAAGIRMRWPEVIVSPDVESTGRVQAWTVGSGLGSRRPAEVSAEGVPVLVDADALAAVPARFVRPALLTPHAGELARMLDVDRAEVEAHRLRHARQAAERWNATVLLKGSTTLVVAPDGRMRINPTGTSALATAGTGDVLAGLAGSLLAAGLTPLDAGSVAAYVHGEAGRLAAADTGYPSAGDVLEHVPAALWSLRRTA